ncbi:SRPBCC family protein [Streptomyces coeruleoprunus]|uniref:SRPBCC family protein n=1 Tax=Streptomyces coeruleoprunus TaxID=285563 RepID=A0ABV9XK70_9ACTN
MSRIEESIDISRRPDDVFSYLTDPDHIAEWEESAVAVRTLSEGPLGVGSRFQVQRRIGRLERPMTMEVTEFDPPRSWHFHGVDGPVRSDLRGRIEPLDDGERSRLTLSLDLEPHGIGKVLVPLVVKPMVRKEIPRDGAHLKELLEAGAS